MSEPTPFRILTVCTGNICRSPAAERLLAARLGPSVEVRSAGTAALVGSPMEPLMARLAAQVGASVEGFAARQVSDLELRQADLVLALTRDHRSRIVELAPVVVRRTYTLLEFAHIVRAIDLSSVPIGAAPGVRLRSIIPLATAMRPLVGRAADQTDDVPDPFRRDPTVYAHALALIQEATDTIISVAHG